MMLERSERFDNHNRCDKALLNCDALILDIKKKEKKSDAASPLSTLLIYGQSFCGK